MSKSMTLKKYNESIFDLKDWSVVDCEQALKNYYAFNWRVKS